MRLSTLCGIFLSTALVGQAANAQLFVPLERPPVPEGNPVTLEKVNLGKALFWDEQLSSTRTSACATCHQPGAGGSDPRSRAGDIQSTGPGPDRVFGTDDDIVGSPGVPLSKQDGSYLRSVFDFRPQVGHRKAPSVINAGYMTGLFLDGRAGDIFRDPVTNQVVLGSHAALESQAVEPVVGMLEMGHLGRDWPDVAQRIVDSRPLALATDIPPALQTWIGGRTYPQLFQEAFGTAEVTPARAIMAIATYERTLFSNRTRFDRFLDGTGHLGPEEEHGFLVFRLFGCIKCHPGNRLTDDKFHYLGVRPPDEDIGRMAVTGLEEDRGKFRTPSLRNVALRAPYFHNGRYSTLEEVIEFYDIGGEFDAPNKNPLMVPLFLEEEEEEGLLIFLRQALTDPRVAYSLPPFDHPTLYTDSDRVPAIGGEGLPGSGGFVPEMAAIEPPLLGNPNFTVTVDRALGRARAYLLIAPTDPAQAYFADPVHFDPRQSAVASVILDGMQSGEGSASAVLHIPRRTSLDGRVVYGRWFVEDPSTPAGWSFSRVVRIKLFK